MNTSKLTIRYLLGHIKAYRYSLFTIIFSIASATVLGRIIYALVFKDLIDLISENVSSSQSVVNQAYHLLVCLGAIWMVEMVLWRIAAFTNNHFQTSIMRNILDDVFARLHHHSVSFFANNFIGSLVTKSKRLVHGFERIMDILYWDFLQSLVVVIASSIVLFSLAPQFGSIILAWSVIFIVFSVSFAVWKIKYDLKSAELDSKVTGQFADSLTNYFNVKIFARDNYENREFNRHTQNQKRIRKFTWDLTQVSEVVRSMLSMGLELYLLYICINFWSVGKITVGEFVLIQSLALRIMMQLWNFGKQVQDLITAFADCKEMTELLYTPYEITDPKKPLDSSIQKGQIEFQSVSFAYSETKPVFNDFNLKIKAGEKIGLVGESGAGKSTFTKLLFRFIDVDHGKILVDSQDISQLKQMDLREQIAYVPQEPILFHRSLRDNIRYAKLDASNAEVEEAARQAHAHDFIINCQQGYDTLVGERGVLLSGGEKQRIAIARAMLCQKPILVLDEATSALDSHAETLIQQALARLMQDKTTIVIAHRLSTLRMMDRILVLEDGQIIEEGSHEELVKLGGHYASLWEHQVGGFM